MSTVLRLSFSFIKHTILILSRCKGVRLFYSSLIRFSSEVYIKVTIEGMVCVLTFS